MSADRVNPFGQTISANLFKKATFAFRMPAFAPVAA